MRTEKYEFRGIGSPRRNFPMDGSLKKRYLSKVLYLYFEEGMRYVRITLMYYVNFYSCLFNHLGKDWETMLKAASKSPSLPSLLTRGRNRIENIRLLKIRCKTPIIVVVEFYQTAIIKICIFTKYFLLFILSIQIYLIH